MRIAALACVPALLACSTPPEPQPVDQDEQKARRARAAEERGEQRPRVDERRKKYYADKARREGKTVEEVTPQIQRDAEKKDAEDERRRLAAERKAEADKRAKQKGAANPRAVPGAEPNTVPTEVPGDPPWIDGYNPEEEHCISGNWCGPLAAAEVVQVKGVPQEMGCPTRIAGGKSSETIKEDPKTYDGLSAAPNMQGALNQHGTELRRADSGDASMCCYHWFEYCSGRPYLGDEGPILAPLRRGTGWIEDEAGQTAPKVSAALGARIASAWLDDARAEHASVAAFARATLELMALGAPPDLLTRAQRAGLDEIDHTQRCLRQARRYGAPTLEPGPLLAVAPRTTSLAQLAADTLAEGCVGETIAALVAQRSARHCTDPNVRADLRRIADDEAEHAALAWATVTWALRAGGAAVVQRLAEVAAQLERDHSTPLPPADPSAAQLRAHGRLDERAHAIAARDAWQEMIQPMLRALLAERAQDTASA